MPPKNNNKKKISQGASRGHNQRGAAARREGGNITSRSRKKITPNRKGGFAGGKRPYDYAAYEREEATIDYMQRLFDKHEYKITKLELERFWQYYLLLRKRNAELDLTRIMGIEATVLKHFIDSAIISDLVEIKGPILDIGTGPGFPGAPIAIHKPRLQVILAESRGKRVRFLEELRSELKLKNTVIFSKSVRDDSPFVPADEKADIAKWDGEGELPVFSVVSRALEVIPSTLHRVKNFIPSGGKVIFMKGPNCGQEVTDSQQEFKGVFKMAEDIRYDLPGTGQSRRLVTFEKR
ncbi:MAG: 16S rRNA (guanine(527)-N(7))-methyltransferase RsmG [Planctomycetes bacterium]|nr:16S rRNA (guanine(527)-N(7))-methyltransferase RsmG [Planctomycetota bacterium]